MTLLGFGRWIARRRVSAGLDGVWVAGLDAARERVAGGPVVFASTHVSYWDPMVAVLLGEALTGDHRFLMDADNLARIRWFSAVGAVPVDRRSAGALRRDLAAATALLDRPGRALWVFPQGRQRPSWVRPLGIQRGAAWLAERAGAALVPVALAYGFHEAPAPAAVVHFGEPVRGDALEGALEAGLARVDRFLDDRATGGFDPWLASSQVREDDSLGSRLLSAWVTR